MGCLLGITMYVFTMIPVYYTYKIKIAPKVFVMEYVVDLIKNN